MSFLETCHKHSRAVNRWCQLHPGKTFLFFLASLICLLLILKISPILMMVILGSYAAYTLVVTIGDGMWRSKVGWYAKHRCEKCGQYVEPKE